MATTPEANMYSFLRSSLTACRSQAVVLLTFTLLSVCVSAQAPLPVEVIKADVVNYARNIHISGMLENKSEQNLAFKIGGLVGKVKVDEGQWVRQGQILASLDLEEIDAEVAKAESVLANAERNLTRFQSLQGSNALSVDRLQQAETQVDVARSDLTVARFNQRHAVIRAPSAGRVLKRFIEPNELVATGKPAFLFASTKTGWVLRAGVTDRDIVRLALNDTAQVRFDAYPDQLFDATVSELAGRADATQTFEVELRLSGKNQQGESKSLLAGFIGNALIKPSQQQKVSLLPMSAMVKGDRGGVDIYLVDDGKPVMRHLPLIGLDGEHLVVTGLRPGDQVIVAGAPYVQPGRELKVVNAAVAAISK
ncbi:hypothetical protein A3759_11675 [Thalassolituus sp. HI0120]|nr:hypothetical protein A3759_11675 [Thalassolituus sp. HI0120]